METTLEQIEAKLQTRVTDTGKAARLYDLGDHWQDGSGFLPFAYMDAIERAESERRIRLGFVSENVIGKVIDNEQNGLLGREPDYSAVPIGEPSETETARLEKVKQQITDAVVEFGNQREILKLFREVFRLAATQERAIVRAFVPPGYVDQSGVIKKQSDLLSAMKLLQFEVLSADKAGVFLDSEYYQEFGVFKSEKDGIKKIELSAVGQDGKTRLRIIKQTAGQRNAQETLPTLALYTPKDITNISEAKPQDLGGQILMFEINRSALIDESIISNQRSVNLNHTMKGRNTYQAGSRDFFVMNGQQPEDEDGLPQEIQLGGNQTNFIAGVPVFEGVGEQRKVIGYANPSIQIVDPIDPENFIKGEESEAAAIYRQCCQEHLTISESATVSGKSKEESRTAFEKKLTDLKPNFDGLGRWYLTVLAYFGANNSTSVSLEDLKKFRFDFNCIVDAGAPDTEATKAAQLDVEKGRLSTEMYLSKYVKIEDVDAEIARLEGSETFKLAQIKLRLEAAQLAKNLGLPGEYTVKLLNIEDETEKANVLAALNVPPPTEPTNTGLPINQ